MDAQEREQKRRKVSSENNETSAPIITLQIANHPVLKQFVEVLEKILETVIFYLVYKNPGDDFTGLYVSTMNSGQTCMIQARFQIPLSDHVANLPVNQKSFALNSKALTNVLDSAEPDEIVTMSIYEDKVRIDINQPNGSSHGVTLFLPRINWTEDIHQLDGMQFPYTVQFKQSLFKKQMKTYKKFDVEKLDFCLYKCKDSNDKGEQFYFAFRGTYIGCGTIDYWYMSQVTSENDNIGNSPNQGGTQLSVNAYGVPYYAQDTENGLVPSSSKVDNITKITPNLENMEEVYREAFDRMFLEHFTKGFEKFDLKIHIGKNLPMILHYPVGASSFIRFILMSCEKQEE
jgi:hypothetical protein